MVAPREPVDRVVDLLVAAPTCTVRAARRAAPLFADLLRRGLSVGAPDDHRIEPGETSDAHDGEGVPTDAEDVGVVAHEVETADAGPSDDDGLAIDDYDHLAARQVVDRLGGLSPSELDAVERYERTNRHRQTILRRIEQLRS